MKFLRLVTHCIGCSRRGVIGFITPHGFLDNPTFRGMRQQLSKRFTKLRFLDLHGNANKKEKCPDGSLDQNVFDILQGTAISVLARTEVEQPSNSAYAELWGERVGKYQFLATNNVLTVNFEEVAPQSPHFLFLPRDYGLYETFSSWPPITDLMPVWNNGLMTSRDDFVFGFSNAELLDRLRDFADSPLSEGSERYGLRDVREMTIKESQAALRRIGDLSAQIKPCLYRPLDVRRLFYHQCLVRWPVFGLMREMSDGKNLGLVTSRMTKGESFAHVMATRHPVEKIALSSKTSNNAYLFPLVIHRRDAAATLFSEDGRSSINLSAKHMGEWFRRMGISKGVAVENNGSPNELAVQVFNYFFAILHAPSYRDQNAEFLRGEYPRLPLTANLELFRALARLGGELTALHLLESPKLAQPITEFIGGRNPEVEKVSWMRDTVWVDKAQTTGFRGVHEPVWNFHIGGYQVCEKWLKDRKGRALTKDDIAHYHKIVIALSETIRIMAEIDKVIEKHGGWPDAFSSGAVVGKTKDPKNPLS